MLLTVAGEPMESTMRCTTTGRICCGLARRPRLVAKRSGGAGEVEQVGALGIVELKRVGEHFEHAVRDACGVAALQALVVLDADPSQRGHLLAAQARHPATAVVAQPDLLGRDLRASARQELREPRWASSTSSKARSRPGAPRVPSQYPSDRAPPNAALSGA